ncbi:hypothetical protein CkaCkLH20_01116 [Colletotrichum karsti]|uniref:Uncharacterized protein n=1 Tax=Colletotrichum karsti TaxID=1095194 RepID=A0A9P6LPY0_9PEZI|nr:uncharacterized protein CkaCkLH20_01116 [Colletotrichum karsti]KAF9880966.1 hypothetical protein CkaCkLH20_01116 [Colletotrichum karsti]
MEPGKQNVAKAGLWNPIRIGMRDIDEEEFYNNHPLLKREIYQPFAQPNQQLPRVLVSFTYNQPTYATRLVAPASSPGSRPNIIRLAKAPITPGSYITTFHSETIGPLAAAMIGSEGCLFRHTPDRKSFEAIREPQAVRAVQYELEEHHLSDETVQLVQNDKRYRRNEVPVSQNKTGHDSVLVSAYQCFYVNEADNSTESLADQPWKPFHKIQLEIYRDASEASVASSAA